MQPLSCRTCRWFDAATTDRGLCRVRPPVMTSPDSIEGDWPLVQETDWCGEWESDDG